MTRELFRKTRLESGVSQRAVAKKCGISKSYLHQIESGRRGSREGMMEDLWQSLNELLAEGKRYRLSKAECEQIRSLHRPGFGPAKISKITGHEIAQIKRVIYCGFYPQWVVEK